jgi:hypothetical protein
MWGRARIAGVCALVALGGGAAACVGHESGGGQPEGGAGGQSTGGTAPGTGARASTGGVPASGGQSRSSGGGPGSGGQSADAAAGGSASVGNLPEAGAEPDAQTADAGDGEARGPLCSIGSLPVGAYIMKFQIAAHTLGNFDYGSASSWVDRCTLEANTTTLTIAPPVAPETCFVVQHEISAQHLDQFCGNLEEHEDVIRLQIGESCLYSAVDCARIDIDRRTGAITHYERKRSNNIRGLNYQQSWSLSGIGWPRCAATESAAPSLPDPPTPTGSRCLESPSVPVGCAHFYYPLSCDLAADVVQLSSLPNLGDCSCEVLSSDPAVTFVECCDR